MKPTDTIAFLPASALILFATIYACTAAGFTNIPVADAFVATGPSGNLSGNNYGGGGALNVAAPNLPKGEFQSLLRFDLSSTASAFNSEFGVGQWNIQSVTLQLTASPHANAIYNPVAPGLLDVSLMQNNSWAEGTGTAGAPTTTGISFTSLNSIFINNSTDEALGTLNFPGGTSGTLSSSLNLTPTLISDIVTGGLASVRLFAGDNVVSIMFSSRSDTPSSSAPELIITAVPEPRTLTLCILGLIGVLLWRCSYVRSPNHHNSEFYPEQDRRTV
jgi:hypothetical protein